MQALLEVSGVSMAYGPNRILKNVNLSVAAGSITAIVGENGAGKSTLIKVISGAVSPTAGEIRIGGQSVPHDPRGAIEAGISVIYQELTDLPDMTVAENVMLGRPAARGVLINHGENDRLAKEALRRVGLEDVDVRSRMGNLALTQKQQVEIARCLARSAKVLVLDEPTSALPESEVRLLLDRIAALRDQGLAVIYISHHFDEVFALAGRIAVLRDGELVEERPTADWTVESLVGAMLGRDVKGVYPWRERRLGKDVLRVRNLSGRNFSDVDLTVRQGELVGIVGLDGSGHEETLRAIAGAEPPRTGAVEISGHEAQISGRIDAKRAGIGFVPRERKLDGLVMTSSVEDNLILGHYEQVAKAGFLGTAKRGALARDLIRRFGVKTSSVTAGIGSLSGGNQQKVLIARTFSTHSRVAILHDPSRGVDVGARAAIYNEVLSMAEQGIGVLFTSSDTDEVLAMADRIYVMRNGRLVDCVERADFDGKKILKMMMAD